MIEYIIWNYGSQIMLAVLCAVFGTLGFVIKKAYTKHANDATKQAVARTVVAFVEQVWVSLHGKDKLNKALEAAETLLKKKGIPFDADEMMLLIEAAVWEFNKAFEGTQKQLET